jgi:hypothetical protein
LLPTPGLPDREPAGFGFDHAKPLIGYLARHRVSVSGWVTGTGLRARERGDSEPGGRVGAGGSALAAPKPLIRSLGAHRVSVSGWVSEVGLRGGCSVPRPGAETPAGKRA